MEAEVEGGFVNSTELVTERQALEQFVVVDEGSYAPREEQPCANDKGRHDIADPSPILSDHLLAGRDEDGRHCQQEEADEADDAVEEYDRDSLRALVSGFGNVVRLVDVTTRGPGHREVEEIAGECEENGISHGEPDFLRRE